MASLQIQKYMLGPLGTNSYLLINPDERIAAIVDPGDFEDTFLSHLENENIRLVQILLTHGHFDHIGGVKQIQKETDAEVYVHPMDEDMLKDSHLNLSLLFGMHYTIEFPVQYLNEETPHKLGDITFQVIHTPGHTPGSVCLLHENILLSGDTLFRNSVGRTDFPGSSTDDLINSIQSKLMVLSDDVQILSGHGDDSTIGHERRINPFIRDAKSIF